MFHSITNADLKICQYLRLHMIIIYWRFYIKTPFTFWDIRRWDMWKVCLQTLRNNRICWKLAYFLRNIQTSRANNSTILRIKNTKFSGYCFYISTNIYGDFRIWISVPLSYQEKLCNSSNIWQIIYNNLTYLIWFFSVSLKTNRNNFGCNKINVSP